MTKKQTLEVLKTKYPNIEIYKPSATCGLCQKGKIAVVFTPNGKVYSYSVKTYKELIEKLM